MSETLVKVENVSKKFCRSLRRSLWYGMQDLGNELVGRAHGGDGSLRPDEFWAVNDVSFELKRGECLGLIGRNGAGKTTLLRLLNGLIKPDKGRIEIRGSVSALIALGAGFNPILTGRENIYVNGSILGLSKKIIDKKLDEIVDFAELRDFIDTPVQSYSSGMVVRLGFSTAVKLLRPDILILDEVLAVGDHGFRAKCYEAISGILGDSAVIFVSHQMPAVQRISNRVLVLTQGRAIFDGDTAPGIHKYFKLFENEGLPARRSLGSGGARVYSAVIVDKDGITVTECQHGAVYRLRLELSVDQAYPEYHVVAAFMTNSHELVAQSHSRLGGQALQNLGVRQQLEVDLDASLLNPGRYFINLFVFDGLMQRHLAWETCLIEFLVAGPFMGMAPVQFRADWRNDAVDKHS
jgi:lipopolysaccharide transport system ATP-binding protein